MNGHFDPQGCQSLLLKESELFFLSLGSWTIDVMSHQGLDNKTETIYSNLQQAVEVLKVSLEPKAGRSRQSP